MERVFLEAARRIELANDVDRLWDHFTQALATIELQHAIYITKGDSIPSQTFVLSTLPDNWPEKEFENPNFSEPFLSHCCATFEVTKVGVEFITDHEGYLDEGKKEYIRKPLDFDLRAGLGIPCRLVGTGRHGGFILSNHFDAFTFERKILPLANTLQSFCLIAHRRIENIQNGMSAANNRKPLSAREYQTLELIAKGVRPKQIAHELQIGEASVRLYLKNARTKLGVSTKEEAVAVFIRHEKALLS
ncbi:MAG: LuxR C-terminal-related transcriptional regulator [Hyphomicrobiales bacterium]